MNAALPQAGRLAAVRSLALERPMFRSPLQRALRKSMERAMRRALLIVLAFAAAAAALATLAMGSFSNAIAMAVATVLVAGGSGALVAIRLLSNGMADLCARPVEMALIRPEIASGLASEHMHWSRARALSRSELESDLETLNKVLRRAARRSRDTLAELERAREQASRQNIAKSQFLASMSHELRTPLNAILGYAILLHEDAVEAGNASAATDLDRIQSAGRGLLRVINDILDLARLEAGKTAVERTVINIAALIADVEQSCPVERRNGNRFKIRVDQDVGIMIGDAGKIRQCLLNLLHNAFKFTTAGTVTLTVSPAFQAANPGLSFAIRDTGIGLDIDNRERLFDPFTQTEPGSASAGSGLGLAITRRLARLMGGDCTVESKKGAGATFSLWVPLRPYAVGRDKALPDAVPVSNPARRGAGPTALIIDDDEAALDLMRRCLKRFGYDVFAAAEGETGLALAREYRPDLILLDALLPGRSGYDILPEICSDPDLNRIPVVLVTIDDDRARGIAAGACDYLRKPVTEGRLRAIVDLYGARADGEILVIDDDDDSAELIKRSVEQMGFSARRASDGVQGIRMASEMSPAGIVLDLLMPGLDGFAVIDRLSRNAALADVPLVIVSGCEISLEQHRELEAAGHRFFTKGSSSPREIVQSLREMVA